MQINWVSFTITDNRVIVLLCINVSLLNNRLLLFANNLIQFNLKPEIIKCLIDLKSIDTFLCRFLFWYFNETNLKNNLKNWDYHHIEICSDWTNRKLSRVYHLQFWCNFWKKKIGEKDWFFVVYVAEDGKVNRNNR